LARILLGVSGGISAYKAVELTRLAMKAGHSLRVVQTERSLEFVGRATFEGITGAPVLISEFERDPARGAFPGEPAPDHDQPVDWLECPHRRQLTPPAAPRKHEARKGALEHVVEGCAQARRGLAIYRAQRGSTTLIGVRVHEGEATPGRVGTRDRGGDSLSRRR